MHVTYDKKELQIIFAVNNINKPILKLKVKRRPNKIEDYYGCVYLGIKG